MTALRDGGFRQTNEARSPRFRPGHVFWLPAGSTWLNRDKPRPFALATSANPGSGTLVYGSTRNTERRLGAAWIDVPPIHAGVNRNGLQRRTYFYPGILHLIADDGLPPYAGFLGRSLHALKEVLYVALGIGQGSCMSPTSPSGSCRGRIVELSADVAAALRTRFALVVTEHRYSATRNYLIIVPVVATRDTGSALDVHISSRTWIRVLEEPVRAATIPIPIVMSVWHGDDIARETEYVVDDQTLGEVDRRLCEYFSLAPPGVDG